MHTSELKSLLHEGIENIENDQLLFKIKQLLDSEYQSHIEPELSDWQSNRIAESNTQIEKGETKSHEEVFKSARQWLKK